MAGDRARVSYDPGRKWRGVIAQQGRVTVEADWNEAATITAERDRLVTLDAVGTVGTPDGGYGVAAASATDPVPGDLTITPGTLYLGGERLDLDAPVTYSAQPDWFDHSTDPLWVPKPWPPAGTVNELVYLLASEQEVSAVEDPALADVALGGPDTMQRQRILQHFVRTPGGSGDCHDAWGTFVGSLGGQGLQFDPASMMIQPAARLKVSFTSPASSPSPCQPVATGGYLGAENQMIRVMVTSVDTKGMPTIVWGFDDASFLYRVKAASYDSTSGNTTLTLASAPVDVYHYPVVGQAVELLRDAVQLTAPDPTAVPPAPGDYIASPAGFVSVLTSAYDPAQMQLVIKGQPQPLADYQDSTPLLYLRVWQGTATAPEGQATPLVTVSQTGTTADTGVAVTLTLAPGASTFHTGDFWRFALRQVAPAIVYPARYLEEAQPPDGPRTWACPLAVLTWAGGNATVSSCVPMFSGLVQLTSAKTDSCTVNVAPSDVDYGASLQALLDTYANRGPVTICLEPGTYTLPAPLLLGPELSGITLQTCRGGVVFQAQASPGPEFTLGLIVTQGATSITIQGIELSIPLTGFSPSAGSFSGLPPANQQLLDAFSAGLQVAIGMSTANSGRLTVADCTFNFPDPGQANVFGAGISATGTMDGVTVTGCTFQSANPPQTVPFYDLAAGNQAAPPYQLTFGYLQVPNFPQTQSPAPATGTAADGTAEADGRGTAGTSAENQAPRGGIAGASASAPQTGQQLDGATLEHCLFTGMTVPVLAMTKLGTLHVRQNTVRNSYGGFWLVSLNDPAVVTMFDTTAVGDPNLYQILAQKGTAATADRIFVIATAIGQVLPATPPGSGALAAGKILPPTAAQLALARQIFSALLAPATITAGPSLATPPPGSPRGTPAETTSAEATPTEATPTEAAPAGLPSAIENLFTPRPAPPQPVLPVTETPTSGPLRLDFGDCHIDAVIAASNSGAGLVVVDFTQTAASALIHDNRIWSSFPLGETALAGGLAETCVTANILANEVSSPLGPTPTNLYSRSIVVLPGGVESARLPGGVEFAYSAAITGNICFGPTLLPQRPPMIPWTLTDWDVLNTVLTYVPPPVVAGLSRTGGTAAGGDNVPITGSGFSGVSDVHFGQLSASSVNGISDTQITATSPPGWGTVDVTVTTPAGTSNPSAADRFTYTGPLPVVTGISPSRGTAGRIHMVTITGSGFTEATGVLSGSGAAVMTVVSDTQIIAILAAEPIDMVSAIIVITPAGRSNLSAFFSYYYTLPAVTGVSPTQARLGETVTITGSGFTGATSVEFVTIATVQPGVVSDTEITVTNPGTGIVEVNITVTNPAGTSTMSTLDLFSTTP